MILESKPLHKKKKRLARKTKDQGSDGSPQVRLYSTTILGWFMLSSMDHTCLLKVFLPLSAHHYSLKKAAPFDPVTGDKLLLSLSFKCVWSAIKNVEDTFESYVLPHLHRGEKWATCVLRVYGEGEKKECNHLALVLRSLTLST